MIQLAINWHYYKCYYQDKIEPHIEHRIPLILFTLIILLIIVIIIKYKPKVPISNWHHHFDGFQFSTQDFYTKVEEEIKKHEFPNVSFSKIYRFQTSIFSPKREYLRVTWKEYVFDICAAPFGTGFYTSWWFAQKEEDLLSKIPLLNTILGINKRKKTYYQLDTEAMFRSAVHSSVMNTIEEITSTKGIRKLTELERQPKFGKQY